MVSAEAEIVRGPARAPSVPERLALRDRLIVSGALVLTIGLAWAWLLRTSGGDAMADMAAPDPWSAAYLLSAFAMWALMMVAMMLPSAAPMILLHARFARGSEVPGMLGATAAFVAAYLGLWLLFSLAATVLQAALVGSGAVSAMALEVSDARLASGLLLLAGLWQLSPLKTRCLSECRSPLGFLLRFWTPGPAGALGLGARHGLHCLGCCWAVMLLLFAGGVMNLAWIGGVALFVLVEKLAPPGWPVRTVSGAVLLAASLYLGLAG